MAKGDEKLMIIGGYSLLLYCDYQDDTSFPHRFIIDGDIYYHDGDIVRGFEFVGENFSECVRQAMQAGWKVDRKNNKCVCPKCLEYIRNRKKINNI